MKKYALAALILSVGVILTACSPSTATKLAPQDIGVATPTESTQNAAIADDGDLARSDEQGSVVVEVRPINLSKSIDVLEFEVSLNTHSVDLSMNLAKLAILSTNTGSHVQATTWDGPSGGHHVSGTLTFPAKVNGESILASTTKLTLTLRDVDAPERTFTWSLSK